MSPFYARVFIYLKFNLNAFFMHSFASIPSGVIANSLIIRSWVKKTQSVAVAAVCHSFSFIEFNLMSQCCNFLQFIFRCDFIYALMRLLQPSMPIFLPFRCEKNRTKRLYCRAFSPPPLSLSLNLIRSLDMEINLSIFINKHFSMQSSRLIEIFILHFFLLPFQAAYRIMHEKNYHRDTLSVRFLCKNCLQFINWL